MLSSLAYMKNDASMFIETEGLTFEEIDSEADYILFSREDGVLSEHFTPSEAAMAYYKIASETQIGQKLPAIYRRDEAGWVLAN